MITFSFMGRKEADAFLRNLGKSNTKGEAAKNAIILHYLDGVSTTAELSELTEISEEMVRFYVKKINTDTNRDIKLSRKPKTVKRENFGH
jgi:hypothetical protein